jgi:hypothetical protein
MPAEMTGQCELAQLVSNHVLCKKNRHMPASIVNTDSHATIWGMIVDARDQVRITVF